MFVYKNYKSREDIRKNIDNIPNDVIIAHSGRLYKHIDGGKYRPLNISEYTFMSASEVEKLTRILNLVWYSTDMILVDDYLKCITDVLDITLEDK